MKKTSLSIFLIIFVFFANQSFAGVSEDEAILLQERLSARQNQDLQVPPPSPDQLRMLVQDFWGPIRSLQSQSTRQTQSFSTNPSDLDILKGTTWQFSYNIINTFTDTLTFGSTVITTSDGTVALSATNEYGRDGAVFYDDSSKEFSAIIEGSLLNEFYMFKIHGNSAYGEYAHKNTSTGRYSNFYDLTGFKVSGPTPDPDPDPDPLFTQEDMDNMYQDGYGDGRQACIEDPLSCGIGDTLIFHSSSNPVLQSGANVSVYGTSDTNLLTLQRSAQANLTNFPGNNSIQILSNSDMFTVYRSGTVVTFQGSDGTLLKIPATMTVQTIVFNDNAYNLMIDNNQVKLNDQVIGTTGEPIQN